MFDFLTPLTAEDFKDLDKALFELNAKEWQTILNAIPYWKNNKELTKIVHRVEQQSAERQNPLRKKCSKN